MLACTGRYVEVPFGASCRGLLDSDTAMCMHTFQFQFQFQVMLHHHRCMLRCVGESLGFFGGEVLLVSDSAVCALPCVHSAFDLDQVHWD